MRAARLYRTAAVLFVLFAAGHTFGFLSFRPPDAAGLAVWDAMNRVHFQVGDARFSYGRFYTGFGLYVTAYLLFSAFLAWQLSGLSRRMPEAAAGIGWTFFGLQFVGLAISWIYFAAAPAILSAAVAVCLAWAVFSTRKEAAR